MAETEASVFDRDAELHLGDTDIEYKPLEKSGLQKFEEKIFSLVSRKKPVVPVPTQKPVAPLEIPPARLPELPLARKTTIEKARDQIKFPVITRADALIRGVGVILFAYGAYLLYATLPTHADLVIGIVIVSFASNLIISQR